MTSTIIISIVLIYTPCHIGYQWIMYMYIYTFSRDSSVQMSLKQNLEKLLDLKLPGPQTSQQEVTVTPTLIHVLWAHYSL